MTVEVMQADNIWLGSNERAHLTVVQLGVKYSTGNADAGAMDISAGIASLKRKW